MNSELLYWGAASLGVVAFGVVLVRAVMIARTWRAGLQKIAQTHGLVLHQPQGAISAIYDLITGELGRYQVSIHIDDESRFGSDSTTRYMLMELSGNSRADLKIAKPGTFDKPGVTDYSDSGGKGRTLLRDPSFDEAVEIRGAKRSLLDALRDDEVFRQRLARAVGEGLIVDGCDTRWRTRKFPKSADAYLQRFDALRELAEQIDGLS